MSGEAAAMTPWEEHHFWLHMLRDHAIFLRDFLSPAEETWVNYARSYIEAYTAVIDRLEKLDPHLPVSAPEMIALANEADRVASGYYQLESRMQNLRLYNEVVLNLTPTYFNGTLNENGEYLRLLGYFKQGQTPPELPLIQVIDLWLLDQFGHVMLTINGVDPAEVAIQRRLQEYSQTFQGLLAALVSMTNFLRSVPDDNPVIRKYARDVGLATLAFEPFIRELVAYYRRDSVANRMTLRFLEHHFPETCYFLRKLSRYVPEVDKFAKTCSVHYPTVP